jgi:uncharacterized protein
MLSLKTLLPDIPENKLRELEIITQRIIDSGYAEIIQLFGSYARGDYKQETHPQQNNKSDFDILIVTLDQETKLKTESEFGNGTRAFNDIETVVQIIVEPIKVVNVNLQNSQFFFTDIKTEGKTLYSTKRVEFSTALPISHLRRREKAEIHYKYFIQEVRDFIKMGEVATELELFRKASFNYQHAAEFLYKTVEMVYSAYQPYEHYLETLRERAKKFDRRIDEPFPVQTEEEKFLFEHLDMAYIGCRYIEEELYSVSKEQLAYWKVEIEKLLVITEIVCKEKIEKLKALECE